MCSKLFSVSSTLLPPRPGLLFLFILLPEVSLPELLLLNPEAPTPMPGERSDTHGADRRGQHKQMTNLWARERYQEADR